MNKIYLNVMNNNLLFVIHKNLHECLLAIKIYEQQFNKS